jgi:hypothetical protein
MFQKKQRIVDRGLVNTVKLLPCLACGVEPCGDAHHVTTKGAGGDDVATNLMPLCREHHVEAHVIGMIDFSKNYMIVRHWLKFAERYDVLEKSTCKSVGRDVPQDLIGGFMPCGSKAKKVKKAKKSKAKK